MRDADARGGDSGLLLTPRVGRPAGPECGMFYRCNDPERNDSRTLPSVWGGGIVGPVATAAVFPPRVQDVGVAVELLFAVTFVYLVMRAA